jgi:hypothetical protein
LISEVKKNLTNNEAFHVSSCLELGSAVQMESRTISGKIFFFV